MNVTYRIIPYSLSSLGSVQACGEPRRFEEQEYPNLFPERESIVGAAIDGTVTCKRPIEDGADPTADFSSDERASSQ